MMFIRYWYLLKLKEWFSCKSTCLYYKQRYFLDNSQDKNNALGFRDGA